MKLEILQEIAKVNRDASFALDHLLSKWEPNISDLIEVGTFGMHKLATLAGWTFTDKHNKPIPFDGAQARYYHLADDGLVFCKKDDEEFQFKLNGIMSVVQKSQIGKPPKPL